MKRRIRFSTNGDITPDDLEMNCEKTDKGNGKKVSESRNHNFIRKVVDYLTEYMSNSNLHGLKYIGDKQRTFAEKIFWILMFTFSVVICAWNIEKVYVKWRNGPDIVTIAVNSVPVWKIPYPAVTVCFETKAMQSKYNFTSYYHLYDGSETHGNMTEEERNKFEDVSLVCDSHLSPTRGRKFGNGKEIVDTLKEICPNAEETFFGCKWQDVNKDYCSDLFSTILTEEGICYTFNTLSADHLFREENLHTDYWYLELGLRENMTTQWTLENGYPDDTPLETYPHRGSGYGAKAGLSFVLKATEVDLDYLCRGAVQGYKILLHNPAEFPQLSQQYFRVPLSQEVVVAVKPKLMTTSEDLLPYSMETRKCYFHYERRLRYFKIYTQANCEMECLSDFTYIRCGCVNFGMLYGPNMTVCGAGSAECVQQAQKEMVTVAALSSLGKEDTPEMMNDRLFYAREVAMGCMCLPSCTSIEYEAETSQADFNWRALFNSYGFPVPPEMNDTYMTRVFIFFKEAQFIATRRSEMSGSPGLLASCGGLLGLFMGFSLLSIVEIIYYLTIRLYCVAWKKSNKRVEEDTEESSQAGLPRRPRRGLLARLRRLPNRRLRLQLRRLNVN